MLVTVGPPDVGVLVGRRRSRWCPPVVVTVTSTVPVAPAGAVAVMLVALLTVNVGALVAPNLTAVAPVRLVPVIVTVVPPVAGPVRRVECP